MLAIMASLRDPDSGCPWDRQQDFTSIVPHTIEEAYEVADAIERGDYNELAGELGDLLFQVVFYAQLGQEQGHFNFIEVVERLNAKLEQRHPHVFAGTELVSGQWEQLKAQERQANNQPSALDNVPLNFPALVRSHKLQKRAARVGFDWDSLGPVAEKVAEELDEVMVEALQADAKQELVQEEIGDLLFAVVNLARHLEVEPEQALRQANAKFERRFRGVEQHCQNDNLSMPSAGIDKLELYWQQVKAAEKR
ncbi:nucleoside triphosphate pyrophosphohydrolase [Ferrimonas lipolytica]|uniref:Nucleoside triphosphate pyrophosphohydrolase n=1 Tax=Ferrimonas lipolytica TaxID=2724191 RepID=A0A6H1UKL3_9GAMM|nr:nucleoside triphosphate pyrophosphohydrolase [Ferrimonas lipolytica]QIZ78766.1 nucleoside triphosphate pyrophosphohydrolase [Ferrimonas lipolytica]